MEAAQKADKALQNLNAAAGHLMKGLVPTPD